MNDNVKIQEYFKIHFDGVIARKYVVIKWNYKQLTELKI